MEQIAFAARAGRAGTEDQPPQNLKNRPRRVVSRQTRRSDHQDSAVAATAAETYRETLTVRFFQEVRSSESASIARKITISPPVAFSWLHWPFGRMENLP